MKLKQEDFHKHIVAQDDDQDYSESGWVALIKDGEAALARYSHCSCYGTEESITKDSGQEYIWDWQGTEQELLKMAQEKLDPAMPERVCSKDDYDYDHLMNVYDQLITHFSKKNTST